MDFVTEQTTFAYRDIVTNQTRLKTTFTDNKAYEVLAQRHSRSQTTAPADVSVIAKLALAERPVRDDFAVIVTVTGDQELDSIRQDVKSYGERMPNFRCQVIWSLLRRVSLYLE